jgi:hypothetical protein
MTTLTMIIGSIISVIAAILLITAFKPQWLFLCRSSLFVVGAVLLNAYAIYVAREGLRFTTHFNHTLKILAALMLGLLGGLVIFVLIHLVRRAIGASGFQISHLPGRLLRKRKSQLPSPGEADVNPVGGFPLNLFGCEHTIPSWLGRGYLEMRDGRVSFLKSHKHAAVALFVAGLAYFIVFFWCQKTAPPSLCSLLLLLILAIWFLSGLGFFLDAYKIPVFISILAIAVVSSPFLDWATYRDRAQALEDAWASNDVNEFPSSSIQRLNEITLGSWGRDVINQKRPSVIFNSTVVETGERMTFHPPDFTTNISINEIFLPPILTRTSLFRQPCAYRRRSR